MSKEQVQAELLEKVKDHLSDPIQVIGYMEHQIDLMALLIVELAAIVDQTKITTTTQDRLDDLNSLLEHKSIDFAKITEPTESYKLPKAKQLKQATRRVQKGYLEAKIRNGLL